MKTKLSTKGSFIYYVRKIFQKTNISYPPNTRTYVDKCKKERSFILSI